MNRRGLTLLELLVSLTILVVVGGMGYEAFRNLFDIQRRIEQRGRMLASCRTEILRATSELARLAPERSLRVREGGDTFGLEGGERRLVFTAAELGAAPYPRKVVLESRAGVDLRFAYHVPRAPGASLDVWESSWKDRDGLPDLIRVTAAMSDPRDKVEDVTLGTLIHVRVQP